MSTVLLALGGAMIGAGTCAAAYGVRRPSLAERLAGRPVGTAAAAQRPTDGRWAQRHGQRAADLLARTGLPERRITRALDAAGTPADRYLAEKATATGLGLVLGAVLMAAGTTVLPLTPLATSVLAACCALACWLAPDLAAMSAAAEHRAELRTATSALADLTVMGLAGGAGVTGALAAATRHGHGRAPDRIRQALHASKVRHRPPWDGLDDLARQTGVTELAELAASLRLGGADGARTRTSLTAKAVSLRARRLAETEASSHAATERMTIPTMGLVAGFLLLIGYTALAHVTAGF